MNINFELECLREDNRKLRNEVDLQDQKIEELTEQVKILEQERDRAKNSYRHLVASISHNIEQEAKNGTI